MGITSKSAVISLLAMTFTITSCRSTNSKPAELLNANLLQPQCARGEPISYQLKGSTLDNPVALVKYDALSTKPYDLVPPETAANIRLDMCFQIDDSPQLVLQQVVANLFTRPTLYKSDQAVVRGLEQAILEQNVAELQIRIDNFELRGWQEGIKSIVTATLMTDSKSHLPRTSLLLGGDLEIGNPFETGPCGFQPQAQFNWSVKSKGIIDASFTATGCQLAAAGLSQRYVYTSLTVKVESPYLKSRTLNAIVDQENLKSLVGNQDKGKFKTWYKSSHHNESDQMHIDLDEVSFDFLSNAIDPTKTRVSFKFKSKPKTYSIDLDCSYYSNCNFTK